MNDLGERATRQEHTGPMALVARTRPIALRHGCGLTTPPGVTYFETFAPLEATARPTVVMVHGGSHSGSCWMLTPDGRPGWAYDFVRRGYPVVVPDWPGVGRSGAIPPDEQDFETVRDGFAGVLAQVDGPAVLLTHSMGGAVGWAIAERNRDRLAAVIALAPGPPGNIQPEPKILACSDTILDVETPHRRVALPLSGYVANDPAFVDGKLIGASVHFPSESRDLYAASLLLTASVLVRQRMNVSGRQIRVADPHCFHGLPVMVVTGSEDLEHPRETDEAIVRWLKDNGAEAEFIWLPELGIEGNGHMLMLERNSQAIANAACDWLDTHLPAT